VPLGCSKKEEEGQVTVVSWGGKYQEALFEFWVNPAAEKAHVKVQGRSYTGEYNTITRMIESETVTWDLVQVETFYAAQAKEKGLLEEFSTKIDAKNIAMKYGLGDLGAYAYPVIGWSYALAWNQSVLDAIPENPPSPNGWKDFWDLDKFPGKRALRDVPQGNIEIALLADGMSIDEVVEQLYKEQNLNLLERAFSKLDHIKNEVVWWTSGDQIQRELESGGITLAATWNGRVWNARTNPLLKNQHPDIRINYEQAILDYDWWIIPKGAKNPMMASKLVASLYEHIDGAVSFAKTMGYGPPIRGWDKSVHNQVLVNIMPTTEKNMEAQLASDPVFWAKHYREITDQWSKWRAE